LNFDSLGEREGRGKNDRLLVQSVGFSISTKMRNWKSPPDGRLLTGNGAAVVPMEIVDISGRIIISSSDSFLLAKSCGLTVSTHNTVTLGSRAAPSWFTKCPEFYASSRNSQVKIIESQDQIQQYGRIVLVPITRTGRCSSGRAGRVARRHRFSGIGCAGAVDVACG